MSFFCQFLITFCVPFLVSLMLSTCLCLFSLLSSYLGVFSGCDFYPLSSGILKCMWVRFCFLVVKLIGECYWPSVCVWSRQMCWTTCSSRCSPALEDHPPPVASSISLQPIPKKHWALFKSCLPLRFISSVNLCLLLSAVVLPPALPGTLLGICTTCLKGRASSSTYHL